MHLIINQPSAEDIWDNIETIVDLVVSANAEYYKSLPIEDGHLNDWIANKIISGSLDFRSTFVAKLDEEIIGLSSYCDVADVKSVQSSTTVELLRLVERPKKRAVLMALSDYSQKVASIPVESSGIYLARIAISKRKRGMRLGEKLLRHGMAVHAQKKTFLHVHEENVSATKLYRSLGFQDLSGDGKAYRVMVSRETE